MIVGVDDAGKGPVIGPMVIAGVLVDDKDIPKLKNLGVADSKSLTPKQREFLYDKIIEIVKKHEIILIPPFEIDEAVFSETTNLNWLEGEKMVKIINHLRSQKAIVDCPSPNIKKFSDFLNERIKVKTELICDHRAERFLPVAAASIISKVTRDREIEKIKKKIKIDFNSGYPSDPKTQEFLKKHYKDYPDIIRKSWDSYKRLIETKKQKRIGEF